MLKRKPNPSGARYRLYYEGFEGDSHVEHHLSLIGAREEFKNKKKDLTVYRGTLIDVYDDVKIDEFGYEE